MEFFLLVLDDEFFFLIGVFVFCLGFFLVFIRLVLLDYELNIVRVVYLFYVVILVVDFKLVSSSSVCFWIWKDCGVKGVGWCVLL